MKLTPKAILTTKGLVNIIEKLPIGPKTTGVLGGLTCFGSGLWAYWEGYLTTTALLAAITSPAMWGLAVISICVGIAVYAYRRYKIKQQLEQINDAVTQPINFLCSEGAQRLVLLTLHEIHTGRAGPDSMFTLKQQCQIAFDELACGFSGEDLYDLLVLCINNNFCCERCGEQLKLVDDICICNLFLVPEGRNGYMCHHRNKKRKCCFSMNKDKDKKLAANGLEPV
ncbi:hypothetical protein Ddc_17501 [Ditylenchus destructor]|nr:hypothetical protein Ddc_17501 [Ditylenchus destructor]